MHDASFIALLNQDYLKYLVYDNSFLNANDSIYIRVLKMKVIFIFFSLGLETEQWSFLVSLGFSA